MAQPQHLIRWFLTSVMVSIIAGLIWFLGLLIQFNQTITQSDNVVWVKPNQSFTQLYDDIESRGWVHSRLGFRLLNRHFYWSKSIQAGEYQAKSLSLIELLNSMKNGDVILRPFTIIEGWNWRKLHQVALGSGLFESIDSDAEISRKRIAKALNIKPQALDSDLMPETYHLAKGSDWLGFIAQANQLHEARLAQFWENTPNKPVDSPKKAYILASLIEMESKVPDEFPVIASVFYNRLDKKMRLQSDPTVIYAMGQAYKGNIRKKDLRQKHPFNTYTIKGLPPGAIAYVSDAVLKAAMNPAQTDYYYFVAKGDGTHYFSRTLREHNRAVRKFILKDTP